jgi:hypothetical protein
MARPDLVRSAFAPVTDDAALYVAGANGTFSVAR